MSSTALSSTSALLLLLVRLRAECARLPAPLQIRLDDPSKYQSIVDAEWEIIYEKLRNCADSGAKIVLSRLAIGDLGTQFFADRDIFCAGRVRQYFAPAAHGFVQPSCRHDCQSSAIPAAQHCKRDKALSRAAVVARLPARRLPRPANR